MLSARSVGYLLIVDYNITTNIMGNLDKKRKLENELNARSNLSEEQKRALQEEINRVQEKLRLKVLRKKKTGKTDSKELNRLC